MYLHMCVCECVLQRRVIWSASSQHGRACVQILPCVVAAERGAADRSRAEGFVSHQSSLTWSPAPSESARLGGGVVSI